jgi:PilZ domain.
MKPLSDIKGATLYSMDCTFFDTVRYSRQSEEAVIIIFSRKPEVPLPHRLFLMPDGEAYDYRAFIFELSQEAEPFCMEESGEKVYLVHAVTNDIPEQRKNLRVYVTMQVSALFEGETKERRITVKDIGTGGFLFVSKEIFQPDTKLTTIFTDSREPVCITGHIQKLRPVRKEGLHGYGCQFVDLSAGTEAKIRNFVYRTNILQSKVREELGGN